MTPRAGADAMQPSVDIVWPADPTRSVATTSSQPVRPLARTLLEDNPMRLSLVCSLVGSLIVVCLVTACTAESGRRTPSRASGSGSGSGSGDEACAKLDKDVVIRAPADMASLPASGCYDIYGKLTVQGTGITSLAGLNGINSVDELDLDHTGVTTIDTKRPLGIYGRLTVTGNARLTGLRQLSFETASSGILIDGNPALASLDPLALDDPKLVQVDGDVSITGNPALTGAPLGQLTKITGALTITGNLALATIDLGQLVSAGPVELADNPKLTSLAAFTTAAAQRPQINGDLVIRNHAALTTLGSMGALNRVTGDVTIDSNPALANLAAFTPTLRAIDGKLAVNNNAALLDLGALKQLDSVGAIEITNNRSLVSCRALEIHACVLHTTTSIIGNNKDSSCSPLCD